MVEQGCQRWFSGCNLCLLSFCYRHGLGVEKEPFGKLNWLKKSAVPYIESAMGMLVHWYDKSLGITADTKLAEEAYKKDADKENKETANNLGPIRFIEKMGQKQFTG